MIRQAQLLIEIGQSFCPRFKKKNDPASTALMVWHVVATLLSGLSSGSVSLALGRVGIVA
jgi:hypothetical protein